MTDTRQDLFQGIEIEENVLTRVIEGAADQTKLLADWIQTKLNSDTGNGLIMSKLALSASVLSMNAALSAASARCRKASPPADVELLTDASGNLIYRCTHAAPNGPHEWSLDGQPI